MNYAGIRVTLTGLLDGARCPVQADIGFGDAVKRLAHGSYPTVTLAEARERREEARKLLSRGLDPAADDGYAASFVLLNPLDWHQLQTQRATSSGEYLFGSPAAPIPPSLWNTPVVLSSSVARGTGVAVDTAYVTLLDRQQVTVEASEHHNDNFTKNPVTVRAEARLGMEVTDGFAVRKFDLSEPASS